jgi:hypothetical protein
MCEAEMEIQSTIERILRDVQKGFVISKAGITEVDCTLLMEYRSSVIDM